MRRKRSKRRQSKPDPVNLQVFLRLRHKRGTPMPTRKQLNDWWLEWVRTGKLKHGLLIRGIFWQNPARHGRLREWRWHDGADLDVAPHPLESSSRGSLEDARETLQELLQAVTPQFAKR